MNKNYYLGLCATIVLAIGLSGCSNDDGDGITKRKGNITTVTRGEMNILEISEVGGSGTKEICWIDNPICGLDGPVTLTNGANETFVDHQMKFTATIQNSLHFTGLHLGIENRGYRKIEDMTVGESFTTFHFNPFNKLSFSIWGETYSSSHGAWSGRVDVVGKETDSNGVTYIAIKLQDLETCAYDESNWSLHTYLLNGVIEFRICEDGLYPQPEDNGIDIESLRMPSEELNFFMMDALHSNESQGRRTFFGEEAVAEECLIINSEEEFRQAYKGNKELTSTGINFDYCTLVIGRTYGEHGGISYGSHELIDNGDSYQLNVTLNNNVNPDYCYTAAFTDIYLWNIYPKMEKKPVVFNRIMQDVTIDPLFDVNNRIHGRFILEAYSDGDENYADGGYHRVGENYSGDKRFYIEFKEDGSFSGRINDTNDFSGNYFIPFVGKRAYYEDAVDHGVINLSNWSVTEVDDDDPVSQKMMQIPNATQFKMLMTYNLTLFISPKQYLSFRRADN